MGQTLTHGVYLPNKGERNCYSGLAANWRLLDGAIGTVAAHTTAIAGKADISHSHGNISNDGKVGTDANKPLITGTGGVVQAGSFGNSANTFCEGNDSRLSDARTPVAHTHTKSDVTDLLNSDFIPSANNSYNLGSSSYQWNNIYSKEYYYNGVAWGLNKANEWSAIQTISYAGSNVAIALKHQETDIAAGPTRNNWQYIYFYDKNSVALGGFYYTKRTNGNSRVYLNLRTKNTNNDIVEKSVFFETNQEGTNWNLYPASNADINLGTSTNKWKTLNGINPGALSLPGAFENINSQIKNPSDQLNAIDLNGGSNTWVSDVDCYLYFYIPNNKFTWIRIFWPASLVRCGQTFVPVPNESSDYSGFLPVPANTTVVIQIKGTQAPAFRRSACLGNV